VSERGGSALIYSAKAPSLSLVKPPLERFQTSFGVPSKEIWSALQASLGMHFQLSNYFCLPRKTII